MTDANWVSAGYAAVWVRNVADPAMAQALKLESAANAVAVHRGVAGYRGYLTAQAEGQAPQVFVVTLFETAEQVATDIEAIQAFGATVDPRVGVQPVKSESGQLRFAHWTGRESVDLAPALGGCVITMRFRQNAPGLDVDAYAARLAQELSPALQAITGFVAYMWIDVPGGRVGINIWETADQLAEGDAVLADWTATSGTATSVGDAEVFTGILAWAELV